MTEFDRKGGRCRHCGLLAHEHDKKRVVVPDTGGRWHHELHCPGTL